MAKNEGKGAAKLAAMSKEWKKAQPKEGFEQLPDGQYSAKILKAYIDESKSGRLQAVFELKICGGENSGKEVKKFAGLDTPENLEWLKGDLVKIDVEPPADITDLPATLDSLTGSFISMTVKTKGEFANYYFNGAISEDDVEEDGEDGSEVDLDSLDKDELLAYIKENDLEIEGAKKMKEKQLREAIQAAISSGDDEEEDEGEDAPDFDSMDKDELVEFIKSNDLEVEGYKKMKEKELRKAVAEAYESANSEGDESEEEEEEEDEETVDLDEMDKDELLAFIKDQEIEIKGAKGMKEKDLRKAIEKALS